MCRAYEPSTRRNQDGDAESRRNGGEDGPERKIQGESLRARNELEDRRGVMATAMRVALTCRPTGAKKRTED